MATQTKKAPASPNEDKKTPRNAFPFSKENYMLMLGGIGLLALGFFIMTLDGEQHGFGFLGLTLGPVIVFLGFMLEIFAILFQRKKAK
jgi:hypothetical protein